MENTQVPHACALVQKYEALSYFGYLNVFPNELVNQKKYAQAQNTFR